MSDIIGVNDFRYEFIDHWATTGNGTTRVGGPTHGVALPGDGSVVVFHQNAPGDHALLTVDANGNRLAAVGDYPGAHGLTRRPDGTYWVTDEKLCVVRHIAPDGQVLRELDPPPQDAIHAGDPKHARYVPTWADVGPDGTIWVGDGYGTSRVFRYDHVGRYLGYLDGTEGAGRFDQPHGLAFSPDGELWITDRGNQRVCVYDADGQLLRYSDVACHSPSAFAFHAGHVYVAEIAGAVKVLDRELNVLADLAPSTLVDPNPFGQGLGWYPQHRPADYPNVPPDQLPANRFHTPHGLAVAENGDVFVVEWYHGGRIIKLRRV